MLKSEKPAIGGLFSEYDLMREVIRMKSEALSDASSRAFSEKLARLKEEHERRSCALSDLVSRANGDMAESALADWQKSISDDREAVSAAIDECMGAVRVLSGKIAEGRISLQNEQIIADVNDCEEGILSTLTALQRQCAASLQRVFTPGIPALAKKLPGERGKALLSAFEESTELAQFMSNELQAMAIYLKEHYKTVTHPLDENHPE